MVFTGVVSQHCRDLLGVLAASAIRAPLQRHSNTFWQVCVCVCLCARSRVWLGARVLASLRCVCVCVCVGYAYALSVRVCVCLCVCVSACLRICASALLCISASVRVHVCVCVSMQLKQPFLPTFSTCFLFNLCCLAHLKSLLSLNELIGTKAWGACFTVAFANPWASTCQFISCRNMNAFIWRRGD